MATAPVITTGFGPGASIALVTTRGYASLSVTETPYVMEAAAFYAPGARAGELFKPGQAAGEVFAPGATAGEVGP